MEVVVMGMHRSGTSLVSRLLTSLACDMGQSLLPPDEHNPGGYGEDEAFYKLNAITLELAGGDWAHPPPPEAIAEVGAGLKDVYSSLVRKRQSQGLECWGWKDPRNCLTVQLYHPQLQDPHYVYVDRDTDAIVASLTKRAKAIAAEMRGHLADGVLTVGALSAMQLATWHPMEWEALIIEYEKRVLCFLDGCGAPRLWLCYEDLVNEDNARAEVQALAEFVSALHRVDIAMRCIKYRS